MKAKYFFFRFFIPLLCFFCHTLTTQSQSKTKEYRLQLTSSYGTDYDYIEGYFWVEFGEVTKHSKKVGIVAGQEVILKIFEKTELIERLRELYYSDSVKKIMSHNCYLSLSIQERGERGLSVSAMVFDDTGIMIASSPYVTVTHPFDERYHDKVKKELRKIVFNLMKTMDPDLYTMRELFESDRIFPFKDKRFNILVLPFRVLGEGSNANHVGYAVKEGLLKMSFEQGLNLNPYYLSEYELKDNFDEAFLTAFMEYHNVKILVSGDYILNNSEQSDDEIGFRILVSPSVAPTAVDYMNIPVAHFNKTNVNNLCRGKIPGNITALVHYVAMLAEVYQFDFKTANDIMSRMFQPGLKNFSGETKRNVYHYAILIALRHGDSKNAKNMIKEALKKGKHLGYNISDSLVLYFHKGIAHLMDDELEEAIHLERTVLSGLNRIPRIDTSLWHSASLILQNALSQQGKDKEAIDVGTSVLKMLLHYNGNDRRKLRALIYVNLGAEYNNMINAGCTNLADSAYNFLRMGLDSLLADDPADSAQIVITFNNLGTYAELMKDDEAALAYYLQGLAIGERNLPGDHPQLGNILNNLGGYYMKTANLEKAGTCLLRVCEIRKKKPAHFTYAKVLQELATLYTISNDFETALKYLDETRKNLYRYFERHHSKLAYFHALSACIVIKTGNENAARAEMEEAEKHLEKVDPGDPLHGPIVAALTYLKVKLRR